MDKTRKNILIIEDNFVVNPHELDEERKTLEERIDPVKKILKENNIDVDLNVKEDYHSGLKEIESNSSVYHHIITDIGLIGPYSNTVCDARRILSLIKEKSVNLYERFEKGITKLSEKIEPHIVNRELIGSYRVPIGEKLGGLDLFSDIFSLDGDTLKYLERDDLSDVNRNGSGANLAYRMKQRNLPFTVFTKDFGHSLGGLISLVVEDIVTPEHIIEIVDQYKPVGPWDSNKLEYEPGRKELIREKEVYLSKDRRLAVGNKSSPQSWVELVQHLCSF